MILEHRGYYGSEELSLLPHWLALSKPNGQDCMDVFLICETNVTLKTHNNYVKI